MQELSQSELKEILHYDQFTGIFTWNETGKGRRIDRVAGCIKTNTDGKKYRKIRINYKLYLAHRLAVLWMDGEFPLEEVDHENGNGLDNWWLNLRCVPHAENVKNKRLPSNNKSGCVGVYWDNRGGKWAAEINIHRNKIHLGYFSDINEAIAARHAASILHGFHPNHGQVRPL